MHLSQFAEQKPILNIEQNFQGQHIVITVGSSGIGLRLAQDLAPRGARLTLRGRDLTTLNQAAAQVEGTVQVASVDLNHEQSVSDFFGRLDGLDHLVTAVAGTVRGNVVDLDVSQAKAMFERTY